MKVILLEDVAKTGRKYEVVEVKNGYGMNYLIPRGKARVATPESVAELKSLMDKEEARIKEREEKLIAVFEGVDDLKVSFEEKASDSGQMFGSLKESDVLSKVNETYGTDLTEAELDLHQPIKELGTHTVPVRIGEKEFDLTIEVAQE